MNAIRRVALCFTLAGLLAAPNVLAQDSAKIVHVRLRGALSEAPPKLDIGALLGEEQGPNLFDMLEMLRKARTDETVKAIVFDLDEAALGLAQIQELRTQFEQLRAAEKEVWVFSEQCGLLTMQLASAASKLIMMPRGEVFLQGIYASPMYFKGTLDKIGVVADVVHCGDFKAAGEPFTRTGPSKEAEADMNKIMDGMFDAIVQDIARSRKMKPEQVKELIDRGPMSAKEAKEAGLVDELMYRQDFSRMLKKRYGDDAKVVRKYGKKRGPDIDFENPFAIFKVLGEMMQGKKPAKGDAVAVIYVDSAIMTGKSEEGFGGSTSGSDTIRKAIDDAAKNDDIKAVVLRVDSPGGSAVASEVIAEAVKRCKARKPFVVSMGDVAASGGYYVACLSDTIFVQPGTITGSIGVIGMKLVTTGMWDHIGITRHEYRRGARSDLMSGTRPWRDDEREVIMTTMTRVYDEFKGRVTEGRGKKLKGDLEKLAGGRIYTGAQALEVGLVDKLGGLADAIKHAADQANLGKYDVRILPPKKNPFDIFSEALGMKDKDDEDVAVSLGGLSRWLTTPAAAPHVAALEAIDPVAVRSLKAALRQLELFSRESVLLIDPSLNFVP